MVIRDADQSVRQFRVSKRSMVAVPAAALLTVTGCLAGLQLRSAHMIGELESQLAGQAADWQAATAGKEEQIHAMAGEIARLNRQTSEMSGKLRDLRELEEKLQRFIDTYGDPDAAAFEAGVRREPPVAALSVSGALGPPPPPAPDTAAAMLRLLNDDAPDFRRLGAMIDTMAESMAYARQADRLRREALDAIPSGWPTSSRKLTSGFGYRTDPFTGRAAFHAGIDIAGRTGDPVFAAADGAVAETGYDDGRGNYIILSHRDGLQTVYMHLKEAEAKEGERVRRGERIGQLGSTGRSTGPHLHFEIMQEDEAVNPLKFLRLVKED